MKRILHLKVTDQVSTLNRITSAFVRLQYNINELTVKPSKEKVSLICKLLQILKMKLYLKF